LALEALNLLGQIHSFLKNAGRLLPKSGLDKSIILEDHVNNFTQFVKLPNVRYEYVACFLFPCIFENKASTWYYSLTIGSITSWVNFETSFITKFGNERTHVVIFIQFSRTKMDPKETINNFS
jgi:hypothetical protein